MNYVVKMYSVTCPSEESIIAVCSSKEQADKLIEQEALNYSDKMVFETEVVA